MKKPIIIGIAGGSASGKTSVAKKLVKNFDDSNTVTIIRQDDYYHDQSHMPFQERLKTNYDHPDAFETDLLVRQIEELKAGKSIEHPTYDYVEHNRAKETIHMEPMPVIIVEGILVLENEELRKRMDLKVFVDTDAEERLIRRILRDTRERGRSVESVLNQYKDTVKPMHEKYIEPSKEYADVIIPRGGHNLPALHLLEDHIEMLLRRQEEKEPQDI